MINQMPFFAAVPSWIPSAPHSSVLQGASYYFQCVANTLFALYFSIFVMFWTHLFLQYYFSCRRRL
jgi:hypothetical protein